MQELTLSALNNQIKNTLEAHLEPSYWVVAEIAQLQINSSGHCYLELVEKEGPKLIAKARATIWAYTFRNISAWFSKITGSQLQQGMRILANVKVSFHEVHGLSINIKDIDPSFTLGERERIRQEVLNKLKQDGVFEMNKSLILPIVPQNVAIISSHTAAGYEDFSNQLQNNPFGYHVNFRLFPAIMQGNTAPQSIINALLQINETTNFDLVVLIRGGGSQLDLDCFDDYDLCSHLAQFPLPILTGIGHERDTSIADIVAHTQLKTPTAVAEFIIQGFNAFVNQLTDAFSNISTLAKNYISDEEELLVQINNDIALMANNSIQKQQNYLHTLLQKIEYNTNLKFNEAKNALVSTSQKIELLNPKHVLNRGYALVYKNGKSLHATQMAPGDEIELLTTLQHIKSTVKEAQKNDFYD